MTKHTPLDEEAYGIAWRNSAKLEGHMRLLPGDTVWGTGGRFRVYPFTCESVGLLVAEGKRLKEVDAAHGEKEGIASNWLARNGLTVAKLKAAYEHGGVEALRAMDERRGRA